jgi:hypothetical protein
MDLPTLTKVRGDLLRVKVGEVAVWFSFGLPVAFRVGLGDVVVSEGATGRTTTATHLNGIDGGGEQARQKRLDPTAFERAWDWEMTAYLSNTREGGRT